MFSKAENLVFSRMLLAGPAIVTITLVTISVTDPVNVTKFVALGILSFGFLSTISVARLKSLFHAQKFVVLVSIGFLLACLNTLLWSQAPLSQSLYGVYGRNNGFLLYIFLLFTFFAVIFCDEEMHFNKLLQSLAFAGVVNIVYSAWVLLFGDFMGWDNPYGNILGTFGNPNFIGSFLGIFSSLVWAYLAKNRNDIKKLIFGFAIQAVTLIEIWMSHAIQGRVLFFVGLSTVLFFLLRSFTINRIFLWAFSLFTAGMGALAILGTLQVGPLTQLLYKDSVSLRGQYWFAGVRMGLENPFTGVGFDSYGDWYRFFRRSSALVRPGVETVSNTAHNVFIDIFAFGGFPLLATYVLIVGYTGYCILKHSFLNQKFDFIFVALVSSWICFQTQSLISINQIGLAIWGWILSSAIIAYTRLQQNEESKSDLPKQNRKRIRQTQSVISPTLKAFGFAALGFILAVPPLSADVKWRSAQQTRQVQNVEDTLVPSYFNPQNVGKYLNTSTSFAQSNIPDLALKYALETVDFDPRSYEAWRIVTLLANSTDVQKLEAKRRMKNLDPLNPDLK
jgi:hypothetical protein